MGGGKKRVDGVSGRGAGRADGPRSAVLLERPDAATPWEKLAAPIRRLPECTPPDASHPSRSPQLPAQAGPRAGR